MTFRELEKKIVAHFGAKQYAYNPDHWAQMEDSLNAAMPKRKKRMLLWWFVLPALLFGIFLSGYWLGLEQNLTNPILSEKMPILIGETQTESNRGLDQQNSMSAPTTYQSELPTGKSHGIDNSEMNPNDKDQSSGASQFPGKREYLTSSTAQQFYVENNDSEANPWEEYHDQLSAETFASGAQGQSRLSSTFSLDSLLLTCSDSSTLLIEAKKPNALEALKELKFPSEPKQKLWSYALTSRNGMILVKRELSTSNPENSIFRSANEVPVFGLQSGILATAWYKSSLGISTGYSYSQITEALTYPSAINIRYDHHIFFEKRISAIDTSYIILGGETKMIIDTQFVEVTDTTRTLRADTLTYANKVRLQYHDFPFIVRYSRQYGQWRFGVLGGVYLGYLVNPPNNYYQISAEGAQKISASDFNRWSLQTSYGVSISRKITRRIEMGIGYQRRQFLRSLTKPDVGEQLYGMNGLSLDISYWLR